MDFDDTWSWDGTSWRELHPKTVPPGRGGHVMTSVGGHAFLYGGSVADRSHGFDDLREWTGDDWVLRSAAVGLAPRDLTAMAAAAGRPVLFGGLGLRSVERLSDTWVFGPPTPTPSAAPH